MQVLIDGRKIDWQGQDLEGFWKHLNQELASAHRVIREVKCDGTIIEADSLDQYICNGAKTIEISSDSANELIDQGIVYAVEYLPILRNGLKDIVSLIQEGNEGEAVSLFVQALEGIEWFNSMLEGLEVFGIEKAIPDELKSRMVKSTEEFYMKIKLLVEAWDNFDYLLIADILEYELVPLLEEWESIVKSLTVCQ